MMGPAKKPHRERWTSLRGKDQKDLRSLLLGKTNHKGEKDNEIPAKGQCAEVTGGNGGGKREPF